MKKCIVCSSKKNTENISLPYDDIGENLYQYICVDICKNCFFDMMKNIFDNLKFDEQIKLGNGVLTYLNNQVKITS